MLGQEESPGLFPSSRGNDMQQIGRLLVLLTLISLVGCGGGQARTTITGKVTVNGKGPLTGGSIQFVLASDPKVIGAGQIKADGAYEVVDAPIGDCKVIIDNEYLSGRPKSNAPMVPGMARGPSAETGKKMSGPPSGLEAPNTGPATMAGAKYIRIDGNYSSVESTPLKSSVARGTATPSDFDVK